MSLRKSQIMTIPQGYKQTELGIIPEDWEVVNFCEVADNFTGLTYAPENVKNYGTLVLRSSNIQDGFLCYEDNVYVDGINIPDRAKAKAGDILVCVRNGSRNLIGKSALISSKAPKNLAFGAFMTVLRAKNGSHNIFIHQIWQSDYIQRQIKDNLGATINQVTNNDISRYIIPMPPIAEQRAIAEALSDVDGLIAALDKKIAKKRLLKQGAMQQLLTGKKRLPGFTDEWVEKTLGEIGTLSMCKRIFQEETSDSGDVPFYKIGTFGQEADAFISKAKYESYKNMYRFPSKGDILISAAGTIGRTVVYDGKPAYFQDSNIIWLAHTQKQILNIYLSYVYQIINWNIENTTIARLYNDNFNNTVVLFPKSLVEQQAIATILSNMDKEIADLEAQRDKYRLLKSGMMQKLLTGQIRLKIE